MQKRLESIKEIRNKMGITQEQMATLLDVSRICIASWEGGQRKPKAHTLDYLNMLIREDS